MYVVALVLPFAGTVASAIAKHALVLQEESTFCLDCELLKASVVRLSFVHSQSQPADILTKIVPVGSLLPLYVLLSLCMD